MNRNIKICYVTSVDITLRFILFRQMKFFKEQGYEVSAVCAPGKWVKDIEAAGIPVKQIGFKRKLSPISDIISFFRLYFYFKKEKFQIVNTYTLKAEFFGQIAARLADVPIITNTLIGLDFQENTHPVKKQIVLWLERIAAHFSDIVFSIAHKITNEAKREKLCKPELLHYIGWGIDTELFNPAKFSPEVIANKKQQLGISPNTKVIGIVARMVAEKGYLDLFEAFKRVLVLFPDAVILAVGPQEPEKSDAVTPEIAKKYGIEKNVVFLGDRTDINELCALMDVFVLPSYREGLGVSLLEASAMAKPVITTTIISSPEVVEDGKTGMIIPIKNPDKLAKAIITLLSDPLKMQQMGLAGREKVVKEFSQQISFDRMQQAYDKLIAERLTPSEPKKIKVCCVTSVDLTLKFMLFNQLKYLQSQGYEVHAVAAPGKWMKDIESEGIITKAIGFKRKIAPIADIIAFFRLYFYFRKERFHVVHTHTLKPEFFGQAAARLADVPIVMNTIHGFFYGDESSPLKKKIFMIWDALSSKFSTLILSISHEIIRFAVEKKLCRAEQIKYLGRDIDTQRFDIARFSLEFVRQKKQQLSIREDQKVVGIVARMVAEKGYLELFEAFKKVISVFPSAILMVVGQEEPTKKDGITKATVGKYGIENNTIFLGERTDTEELYPLMDIFALPTHREGLGAVILEASSMERPVIATLTGGCPEAVDNGKTGILVPVKDANRLAEAIIDLLSHPEKAIQMGKAGREKIVKEFSQEIVLSRLGNFYTDLINKKLSEYGKTL